MEIKIKKGYGDIVFGTSYNEIVKKLGKPSEIIDTREDKEEGSDEFVDSITAFFDDNGLAMFFEILDGDTEMTLQSIEIDETSATMFEEKIFDMKQDKIVSFLEKNLGEKPAHSDIDDFEGEEDFINYDIVDFEASGVSLLFEEKELISVTIYCN